MRYEERTLKEYAIVCNRCGDRGPWGFSKQEARELAEEYGWRLKDGPLCPECQEREEEERRGVNEKLLLKEPDPVREAYQYARSFPVDEQMLVKGPAEIDGLPPYVLYFWYLARHGEADYHFPGGIAAYKVRGIERAFFPTLTWDAVAVWEENGFVRYSVAHDVHTAVYGCQ
jgi:hypothetical protein